MVELISSRKTVPVWAASKRPVRLSMAPVNAPRTWPNSSLSSRFSASAPQLTRTNGPLPRGLSRWIALAISSLPVPVSPEQQHRGVGPGHLARQAIDFPHRRPGADQAGDRRPVVAGPERCVARAHGNQAPGPLRGASPCVTKSPLGPEEASMQSRIIPSTARVAALSLALWL